MGNLVTVLSKEWSNYANGYLSIQPRHLPSLSSEIRLDATPVIKSPNFSSSHYFGRESTLQGLGGESICSSSSEPFLGHRVSLHETFP